MIDLWVWRHPRAIGAGGRCIGRTDLAVDRRKAKRLAGRIRAMARRHRLPNEVWTSPLRRCADVGRILRSWGWTHHVDDDLTELDFGLWDGRSWADIPHEEVARWEADFIHHAPGGGESQAGLRARIARFVEGRLRTASGRPAGTIAVSHAGWIAMASAGKDFAEAQHWPAPVATMALRHLHLSAAACTAVAQCARRLPAKFSSRQRRPLA